MIDRRNLSFPALRAFEATAKHLNMGRASEELGLTHAAVSHQVRLLEDRVGVELFSRSGNKLTLTAAGQRLKTAVTDGIDRIIDGARYLDPDNMSGTLVVGCTQTIASCWAAKHIIAFNQSYPTIAIEVREIPPVQRRVSREIDVAICYGAPEAGERRLTKLAAPDLYPVCSPSLVGEQRSKLRIGDIASFTLIHDGQVSWDKWFQTNRADPSRIKGNIYFPNTSQALRAAILGGGVALSNTLESQDYIRDGQLIQLFDKSISEEHSYWLLAPSERNQTMKSALFEEWMIAA